jgi:hypothetical protein
MNDLADSMILARNIVVGGLALFAGYTIVRKYVLEPFWRTFKFLSNMTADLKSNLQKKYGTGDSLVVVMGSTTGLGPTYAMLLGYMGFKNFALVDSDLKILRK